MPTFYHGTLRPDAITMAGTPANGEIDVSLGGGEFGQGFYTQTSKSNALAWAQNHCGQPDSACLLEVEIDDAGYNGLHRLTLDLKQAKRLTQRLRKRKTTRTHLAGVDAMIGPLNGSRRIQQQKFESPNAQTLLNGLQTRRTIV